MSQTTFWGGKFHEDKLGCYVYGLLDPRSQDIFYIGKAGGKDGAGNARPQDHLVKAYAAKKQKTSLLKDKKLSKIIDINTAGYDVELIIIRRNLNSETAHHVEAALIDLFNLEISKSRADKLTNKVAGHSQQDCGIVTKENLFDVVPVPVNPSFDIPHVWLFNIDKAVKSGKDLQEAVRGHWVINKSHLSKIDSRDEYGVGLIRGIAKVVVKLKSWSDSQEDACRKVFQVECINDFTELGNQLYQKDFSAIVSSLQSWRRGNKVKVEFINSGFNILIGKPKIKNSN